MDKQDQHIINEIAQELDCGNECFLNRKTGELICIPNPELMSSGDEDFYKDIFKEDLKKIKSQKKDLIKFEVPESFESFKIMENFKNQVVDDAFREKLEKALERRKPFQNFNFLIDNSDYREDWFAFKQKALENRVRIIMELKKAGK